MPDEFIHPYAAGVVAAHERQLVEQLSSLVFKRFPLEHLVDECRQERPAVGVAELFFRVFHGSDKDFKVERAAEQRQDIVALDHPEHAPAHLLFQAQRHHKPRDGSAADVLYSENAWSACFFDDAFGPGILENTACEHHSAVAGVFKQILKKLFRADTRFEFIYAIHGYEEAPIVEQSVGYGRRHTPGCGAAVEFPDKCAPRLYLLDIDQHRDTAIGTLGVAELPQNIVHQRRLAGARHSEHHMRPRPGVTERFLGIDVVAFAVSRDFTEHHRHQRHFVAAVAVKNIVGQIFRKCVTAQFQILFNLIRLADLRRASARQLPIAKRAVKLL